MTVRTFFAAAAAVIVGLSTAAAGAEELRVAATPVPHADILKLIEPDLQKDGYDLKIVEFSDYVSPNLALDAGEVDANYYQHKPFLDAAVEHRRLKIASVAPIHILPMAAYSKKVKKITDLADGASVTIPNDPANGGRALLLLEDAGLLKLKPGIGVKATVLDIVSNPKHLRIREVEAAQVPRTLDDVDLAVVNSNYAIGVGLNPVTDSIYLESKTSPYAVVVAARQGHEKDAKVQALVKALTTEKVRKAAWSRCSAPVPTSESDKRTACCRPFFAGGSKQRADKEAEAADPGPVKKAAEQTCSAASEALPGEPEIRRGARVRRPYRCRSRA